MEEYSEKTITGERDFEDFRNREMVVKYLKDGPVGGYGFLPVKRIEDKRVMGHVYSALEECQNIEVCESGSKGKDLTSIAISELVESEALLLVKQVQ